MVKQANCVSKTAVTMISYQVEGDPSLIDGWNLPVQEVVPALSAGLPPLRDLSGDGTPEWEYRTFRPADPLSARNRSFLRIGVTPAP